MNLAQQLFHRISDPTLKAEERARLRCQLAKQLEDAGNYEAAREIMGELWQGIGHRPSTEDLDERTAAESILRAGVLTGWIGGCKKIEGTQETAKNLISESLTRFETLGEIEKIAEAQTELSYCYWRQGAFDEARVWLQAALDLLPDNNEGDDVKALALLRLTIVERSANRLNDALHIHISAAPLFERSTNQVLKGKYHNGFGITLKDLGTSERRNDYIDRALIEFAAASYHFEQAGHSRYQAHVENNIGFLFSTIKKFPEAHEHLDRAQALFTHLKDKVHIAQVDDTRARVLLEEGRVGEAEKFARSAVRTLEGDDQRALYAEALTTHGTALARLGRNQEARLTLQSAVVVAQNAGDMEGAGQAALTIIEELGEGLTPDDLSRTYEHAYSLLSGSKHPANKDRLISCARRVLVLSDVLPGPEEWKNFSLKEAVHRYEGRIIERALRDAGGIVTRAAHMLGFKHHTSLINRLNTRHKELLAARTPIEPRKRSMIFVSEDEAETQPLVILYAGDDQLVTDMVREVLEMEGWAVENCLKGDAALATILGPAHFDVLILEQELPGMTGIELTRRTRMLPRRQQTPIIILSTTDIEREARRAGANAFLKKPEDMSAIAETIARLLARKPKQASKGRCE